MKISRSKKTDNLIKRKFTIQAAKVGKTKEVIVLQGNYGYGWDDLVEYETSQQREAAQDLRDYRENEKGVQHRLIRRRVPNPDYVAQTDRFSVLTYTCGFKYKNGNPTKFSDINEAIEYANQLWESGEETVLKDSVTGYNIQLIPNNIYQTNRNIERFKETVNKDAGTIDSSTRNKRKFSIKASSGVYDRDTRLYLAGEVLKRAGITSKSHGALIAYYLPGKYALTFNSENSDMQSSDLIFTVWNPNPKDEYDYAGIIYTDLKSAESGEDESEACYNKGFGSLDEWKSFNNFNSALDWILTKAQNSSDIEESTSIEKRKFTVKASKSAKKSKIMAGGVYPEYLENTDDLASVLERKLKSATGIDFEVVPDSIEYITTRHWVHCDPGWFKMKIIYPIDSREDYEFLEQISPYIGDDTPIIQKVISDETIRTNSYSDIEIGDSDDKERYYDGLTFDYIDDDSYTFTLDEFNKEQDIIGAKVIEKIYAIHDELAKIISDYVVIDEEDYYDIEESTEVDVNASTDITASIGRRKLGTADDAKYYEALAEGVVKEANTYWDDPNFLNLTYDISEKAITFTDVSNGKIDVVYIQPLNDINPDWDDLDSDIEELFESVWASITPKF